MFLSCKKMYWEAVQSLFENIKPIFTSSEDAHRFFIQIPHPYAGAIRSLEFSFTNPHDHLFLKRIKRENTATEPINKNGEDAAEGGDILNPADAGPGASNHGCMTVPCRIEVFGQELWEEIVDAVQDKAHHLKDLHVTIGGSISRDAILSKFGGCPEHISEAAANQQSSEPAAQEQVMLSDPVIATDAAEEHESSHQASAKGVADAWKLPGKMEVSFKVENCRYVQDAGHMVRQ